MRTFLHNLQNYISRHDLMRHDGFYVVALSGGADSVALLCALWSMRYRVEAVHCNFRLRGEESDRDERFCVSLCEKLGVTLHRIHFDTLTYASLHKVSIEMAARELRYRYFEQLRQDLGADGICVAHHRDDQVETVLLNLVRGTGLTGLQGMRLRNGYILRPLLGVSRKEIVGYLEALGQGYVTDSTNLEADAMRNKLRLNIIPMLEEINPAVRENIARMTENLSEVSRVVDFATRQTLDAARMEDGSIDLSIVFASPSPQQSMWTLLEPLGFNRTQLLEMLSVGDAGGQWLSADKVAVVDRGRLYLLSRSLWEQPLPTLRIPECGTYVYPFSPESLTNEDGQSGEMKFRFIVRTFDTDFQIDRSPRVAQLDADMVRFPLTIRPIAEGDRFVPFGMKGSKSVSDFLKDSKVALPQRHGQLVVEDFDGNILWLVGQRIDDRFALRHTKSKNALVITY
ncbi:MAG: tRNA lysidine(34) synthetase TilS [Prevotella sp.]|nr:tRNA lysidine(34) synthetase TilS [Prevotella sp.]